MTDEFLELDLRQLDEALRASAKANGWVEPDTTTEGLIPEEPIQEHPAGPLRDVELDALPLEARFFGWVTGQRDRRTEEFTVYAISDPEDVVATEGEVDAVHLGTWQWAVVEELLRRYREAAGDSPPT